MSIIIIFTISFVVLTACQAQDVITFDLANFDPHNETTHIQKEFRNLTQGNTEICIENAEDPVGFFIVQVHTHHTNVTLSSSRSQETGTFITGTNVGLYGPVQFSTVNAIFYITASQNTEALVVVTVYNPEDPVPGGCNLSFDTIEAPYQIVSYDDDLVTVKYQAPSVIDSKCELNNVGVEMYHLYLQEHDFTGDLYFDRLQQMLTVEDVRQNGYRVRLVDGYFKYNKLYSAYRGVGHMFAIIATFQNRSSAYVPAVTYACDIEKIGESCYGPITSHWKVLCASLLIFGMFMTFFGHKFFRCTLYIIGLVIGIFITYIILSASDELSVEEKTTTSILIGFIYGSVWLFIWWKFGIPILSVVLSFFLGGLLIGSIVFYAGVADLFVFHNDVNFWMTQFSIILAFGIVSTMFTLRGHIITCTLLGSYACIVALNFYTGGNLQYIMINTFRRIVVEDFNMATIDPPFQVLDGAQTLLWIVLLTFGLYYQLREQRGKPPFPPPRYVTVQEGVSETTPLLRDIPPPYEA